MDKPKLTLVDANNLNKKVSVMDELRYMVVSPSRRHLDDIVHVLRGAAGASEIAVMEGDLPQLGNLAGQTVPDVLIVDSSGDGRGDLAAMERLGALYPTMSFIVLRELQSADFLIQAMRAGVREVLPLPLNADALSGALQRTRQHLGFSANRSGKILSFISCKGGSGATFLAANLAYTLATQCNKKVALFDLNLQFGDALLFLSDHKPAATLADAARGIHRLDPAFLASSMVQITPNLGVLASPEDPAQATEIKPEHIDSLLRMARNQYDFVILDVGRSLDARTIKALDHADMIFMVLQLTLPFIRDGKRLAEVFRTLDYPKNKIHLIVNRYHKGGDINLENLQQSLGSKVMRTIPNHYEAAAASVNQGIPIAKLEKNSPVSKALAEWSEMLAREPEKSEASWIKRVFKRA